jgi:hypothetical protein
VGFFFPLGFAAPSGSPSSGDAGDSPRGSVGVFLMSEPSTADARFQLKSARGGLTPPRRDDRPAHRRTGAFANVEHDFALRITRFSANSRNAGRVGERAEPAAPFDSGCC